MLFAIYFWWNYTENWPLLFLQQPIRQIGKVHLLLILISILVGTHTALALAPLTFGKHKIAWTQYRFYWLQPETLNKVEKVKTKVKLQEYVRMGPTRVPGDMLLIRNDRKLKGRDWAISPGSPSAWIHITCSVPWLSLVSRLSISNSNERHFNCLLLCVCKQPLDVFYCKSSWDVHGFSSLWVNTR